MLHGKKENRAWGAGEYDELLAGLGEPGHLREADRRGMTPAVAAALDAGSGVSRLMSLLDSPGATEGETALDSVLELLGELVAGQRVTNELLNAVLRILSSRAARDADEKAAGMPEVEPPSKARRSPRPATQGAPAG